MTLRSHFTRYESKHVPPPHVVPRVAKTRACLQCGHGFRSKWAGDRVCGRCKTLVDWCDGETVFTRAGR